MRSHDHITGLPAGATILAWHTSLDLAAYCLPDGSERLAIDGASYKVPRDWHHPTQLVINICHQAPAEGAAMARRIAKRLTKV